MAKHETRICDWKDGDWTHESFDDNPCGRQAPYDAVFQMGELTLHGDFCGEHRELVIARLQRIGGMVAGTVRVDSKPRQSYVTKSGKVVATRDIRKWALDEGRVRSQHGRLATELIQEYVDSH